MALAVAVLIALLAGPLIQYRVRMQATTLWIGKRLSAVDSTYTQQVVVQSAVTPKSQDKWNAWWYSIPLTAGGLGFLHAWWGGLLAWIVMLLTMVAAARLFVPTQLEYYLQFIVVELQNRLADYVRDGDSLRADAMQDILPQVQKLLDQARAEQQSVPEIWQVRAMQAG